MKVEFSALTDVGRVRPNNEDAVTVIPARGLAVLADGMGGYNAGEVASAMAVEQVAGGLSRWLARAPPSIKADDVRRAMETQVNRANQAILRAARTTPAYTGMGTTLVVAVLRGGVLTIGHVGDSRAYRWHGGTMARLTRDHSLVQAQIDDGVLTAEQAATASNRNLVTRALGVEPTVPLDLQDVPVAPGDTYLLCSDGLTDMVADADIAAVLGRPGPLDASSRGLIALANQRGGRDNVSVALIRVLAA